MSDLPPDWKLTGWRPKKRTPELSNLLNARDTIARENDVHWDVLWRAMKKIIRGQAKFARLSRKIENILKQQEGR